MFWQKQAKDERAYSVLWFQVQSVTVGKSRNQELEADARINSTLRKQKGSNTYYIRAPNLTRPLDLNMTDSMMEIQAVKLNTLTAPTSQKLNEILIQQNP